EVSLRPFYDTRLSFLGNAYIYGAELFKGTVTFFFLPVIHRLTTGINARLLGVPSDALLGPDAANLGIPFLEREALPWVVESGFLVTSNLVLKDAERRLTGGRPTEITYSELLGEVGHSGAIVMGFRIFEAMGH